jgi:hypothetical protein
MTITAAVMGPARDRVSPSAEKMMKSLRIQGVVRLAQRVRRELAQPISAVRQAQLRRLVADAIAQVDRILAAHGTVIAHLPAPTRLAYQFLASLELDAPVSRAAAPRDRPPGDVTLVGLKGFWDGVLDGLARATGKDEHDRLYQSISSASETIERHLQNHELQGDHLTATSRTVRGWLAYFAQRENFEQYVAALGRARPILETALSRQNRFRSPAILHFRPVPGLYRLRGYANGTRVLLPTPMISFSDELFRTLADALFNGKSRQRIAEAVSGEECQAIQAELESLGGIVEQPAGLHHDLASAFARVNADYFDNALSRPRLTWSRTFTGRKFGHYDPIQDTVLISCSLDRADVPAFVLDFVMYHELLHKKLGVDWRQGRAAAHTSEFREAERRFERHTAAEAVLKHVATGH